MIPNIVLVVTLILTLVGIVKKENLPVWIAVLLLILLQLAGPLWHR